MLSIFQGLPRPGPDEAAVLADAAAVATDPRVLLDAPPLLRAAASFVLVLLFGGVLLFRFEEFVTDSVDSSMTRPLVSTLYGVAGLAAVIYLGFYAYTQATTFGGPAADLILVAIGVVVSTMAGLGFTVVGVGLTDATGDRRPWTGLLVGAGISALAWLIPALAASLVLWVAFAGTGIGGPTRAWIHAAETVETDGASE